MRFRNPVEITWHVFLVSVFLSLFSFGRVLLYGFYIPCSLFVYSVLVAICITSEKCRNYWRNNRYVIAASVLMVISVLLSLVQARSLRNIGNAAEIIIYVSMIITIPSILNIYRIVASTWKLVPVYTIGVVALDVLVQNDTPWLQLGDIGSRNVGAFLLVVSSLLSITVAQRENRVYHRILWLLISIILGVLVFHTWSRGGILVLIFSGIVLILVQGKKHIWYTVTAFVLIVAVGFVTMPEGARVRISHIFDFTNRRLGVSIPHSTPYFSPVPIKSPVATRSPATTRSQDDGKGISQPPSVVTPLPPPKSPVYNSNPWRLRALRQGINWLFTHPLSGIGVGNIPPDSMPHNSYILMGAETGVLGLLGFVVIVSMMVIYIFCTRNFPWHPLRDASYVLSVVLILYTLFADMPTWIYFWVFTGIGFSFWSAYKDVLEFRGVLNTRGAKNAFSVLCGKLLYQNCRRYE